jgi:ABC-type phosphate/phosphonate transport system substrate-binding protein
MIQCRFSAVIFAVISLFTTQTALAADTYIFSAPPRGPAIKESKVYDPIADYLSAITGKKIVYKHPGNWLTYQGDMQKGKFDFVFDGPHFVSWRMAQHQHEAIAKLPGKLAFVVVVKKDNEKITSIKQLAGHTVCGLAPPNLATLTMYSQFDNPLRQPLVIEVKSFKQGFEQMMKGNKCMAAVMRDKFLNKMDKDGEKTKIIWSSQGVANQAFSIGPRFTAEEKDKIRSALLAPEATEKMSAFMDRFNKKKRKLQPASSSEYNSLYVLLKDVWGFEIKQAKTDK